MMNEKQGAGAGSDDPDEKRMARDGNVNARIRMNMPWVESPFFEQELAARDASPEMAALARKFHEDGYVKLEGVVDPVLVDAIRADVLPLFRPGVADGARSSYRVQDAWIESEAVRKLAGHEKVLSVLEFLYGRKPFPFQTLNFLHGSQQRAHSDTIHFSSLPALYMCGAWAALEDITPDNGPLFYYPGSHRLPAYTYYDMGMTVQESDYRRYEDYMEALMAARGLRKEILSARKGDVLLWASNLVHGGEPILRQGSTRWSQVTHYYFEDCAYLTPLHSNYLTGEIFHRDVRDVRTGKRVPQTYNGRRFHSLLIGRRRYRLSEKPGLVERTVSGALRAAATLRARLTGRARGPGYGEN